MTHPSGAGYRHEPKWLDDMHRAEGGKVDDYANIRHRISDELRRAFHGSSASESGDQHNIGSGQSMPEGLPPNFQHHMEMLNNSGANPDDIQEVLQGKGD